MPRTILLADLPPLLEDIVFHVLCDCADLHVVRGSAADGIEAAAAAVDAEMVIVVRRDPASFAALDEGLVRAAGIRVLALNGDATWGCLHRLQPQATRLGDISAAQLRDTLGIPAPGAGA